MSLKLPVGNLAFASNILPGSAIIYPYRYDKYNVSLCHVVDGNTHKTLIIFLSFCVVSHFHQHPKENMYEEVGDQK